MPLPRHVLRHERFWIPRACRCRCKRCGLREIRLQRAGDVRQARLALAHAQSVDLPLLGNRNLIRGTRADRARAIGGTGCCPCAGTRQVRAERRCIGCCVCTGRPIRHRAACCLPRDAQAFDRSLLLQTQSRIIKLARGTALEHGLQVLGEGALEDTAKALLEAIGGTRLRRRLHHWCGSEPRCPRDVVDERHAYLPPKCGPRPCGIPLRARSPQDRASPTT